MNAAARLAAFAVVLAVLFGGGLAAGGLVDPAAPGGGAERAEPAPGEPMDDAAHGAADGEGEGEAHGATAPAAGGGHGAGAAGVRGLAVAENGLRLVVDDPELRRGVPERLRFRIVDEHGRPIRDFDTAHTKKLHLIVARRDLSGFRHLHPTMSADGTWSTTLRLGEAGSYRLFADFTRDGRATTLATDLHVDGAARLDPLPAPAAVATSDGGYDVRLEAGTPRAGRQSLLRFAVTRDGRSVHVEPYLGADGHLVALREGDLAFLHVHPVDGDHEDGTGTPHDDSIGFEATFPTAGRYGLFLQVRHGGRVQTVAFTLEVDEP